MSKYEIVKIENVEVTFDLSIFIKTEELWFNATEVAKFFGKDVKDWFKNQETHEYLTAILEEYPFLNRENSPQLEFGNLIKTSRGRYGGTYLHKLLSIAFGRWCSAKFAVKLDKFIFEYIRQEQSRKAKRLEAKTGYRPMTDAIQKAHNPCEFYHYTNEINLLNKIITGKTAKQLCEENNTENARECMCAQELLALNNLQIVNTGLIMLGVPYEERKEKLEKLYKEQFSQEAIDNEDVKLIEEQ